MQDKWIYQNHDEMGNNSTLPREGALAFSPEVLICNPIFSQCAPNFSTLFRERLRPSPPKNTKATDGRLRFAESATVGDVYTIILLRSARANQGIGHVKHIPIQ